MAAPMASTCRRYLLLFAHEHLEFRLSEFKSIATIFGIKYSIPEDGFSEERPYLLLDVESEECVRKIMSRTMSVKSLYELWGQGSNFDQLSEDMKRMPEQYKAPFLAEDISMCMKVETFNRTVSQPEKIQKIERILAREDAFPFKGSVNLKNPDQLFHLLEYYEHQSVGASDKPLQLYFVRWITDGQREHIKKYNLQDRKYLGNTSMDPALSLIMANMGTVRKNDFVFDPFVGTGSITVACAHFEAYVAGTDIDYNLLMGRGKSSKKGTKWRSQETDNLRANLRQYGLERFYLDVMVADSSLNSMWRPNVKFDAIITDPPYGVREATEKVGSKKPEQAEIPEHLKEAHIPCRIQYDITEVFNDLLVFAAKHLRLNGRLVYWLPIYRPEYNEDQVPRHPCLQLVSNSEQVLAKRLSRRLITMEKIKEWEREDSPSDHLSHYQAASFRDMYFRPTDYEVRNQRNKLTENGTCDGEEERDDASSERHVQLNGALNDLKLETPSNTSTTS